MVAWPLDEMGSQWLHLHYDRHCPKHLAYTPGQLQNYHEMITPFYNAHAEVEQISNLAQSHTPPNCQMEYFSLVRLQTKNSEQLCPFAGLL